MGPPRPVAARPGIRNPARTWLRSLPTDPYQTTEMTGRAGFGIVEPGTFVPGPKAGTLLAETVMGGAANSLGGKPTLFP